MNLQKIRGLMGLCVRAGQGIFGEDACMDVIRKKECGVLLLDGAVSGKTEERYLRTCGRNGIPCVKLPCDLLEQATGKPGMAMAIRKGAFTERVLGCLDE